MTRATSKPGPPPTSCFTCRRRRKKCDLSRPYCERCLKGGFECLGYGDRGYPVRVHRKQPCAKVTSPPSVIPIRAVSQTPGFFPVGAYEHPKTPTNADSRVDYDTGSSILGAALLYRMNGPIASNNEGWITSAGPSEDLSYSWPQDHNLLAIYPQSPMRQPTRAGRSFDSTSTPSARPINHDLCNFIRILCHSVPPSVNVARMMGEDHFAHVTNDYLVQRISGWFMAPPPVTGDSLLAQVKGSKRMTWTMYLGAKLFQALGQNPQTHGSAVQGYIGWIDKLEQKFTIDYRYNPPLKDTTDCFMVQLELTNLNFSVVDNFSGYALLQRALPRFLRLVAANSALFMEHSHGNLVVSFHRTLSAPRYEIQRFVMYDMVAAFMFGISPLVEYGYDGECDPGSHKLEWVHGIPVVLFEAVSQVNSWRAGSRVPLDNWQTLERRVLAWQSPYSIPEGTSDIVDPSVARGAVQEGWRHVVLIYIYMGICGVSSHDPRVQASVHQIVQLGEIVAGLPICVQMFAHCIVAGLGARLERHRVFVHKMLPSFKNTRVWLFQGPQFIDVLYRLWHGVGARGAPVSWDDYVQARRAVIPI